MNVVFYHCTESFQADSPSDKAGNPLLCAGCCSKLGVRESHQAVPGQPHKREFWALVSDPDQNDQPVAKKFWIACRSGQTVIGEDPESSGWLYRDAYHQPINPEAEYAWVREQVRVMGVVLTMAGLRLAHGEADWDQHMWDLGFRP
jgi:hypothetical protein